MTDFDEPGRKNVQQEAADKLRGRSVTSLFCPGRLLSRAWKETLPSARLTRRWLEMATR